MSPSSKFSGKTRCILDAGNCILDAVSSTTTAHGTVGSRAHMQHTKSHALRTSNARSVRLCNLSHDCVVVNGARSGPQGHITVPTVRSDVPNKVDGSELGLTTNTGQDSDTRQRRRRGRVMLRRCACVLEQLRGRVLEEASKPAVADCLSLPTSRVMSHDEDLWRPGRCCFEFTLCPRPSLAVVIHAPSNAQDGGCKKVVFRTQLTLDRALCGCTSTGFIHLAHVFSEALCGAHSRGARCSPGLAPSFLGRPLGITARADARGAHREQVWRIVTVVPDCLALALPRPCHKTSCALALLCEKTGWPLARLCEKTNCACRRRARLRIRRGT